MTLEDARANGLGEAYRDLRRPAATDPAEGDRVVILGGFEDGIVGTVVANEPTLVRPYRYRVQPDENQFPTKLGAMATPPLASIGGLHPINLQRCG